MPNKKKKKITKRSIPASKLMGLVVSIGVSVVILYTMVFIVIISNKAINIGISPDFTPLNTLVAGALALAAAYVGFYINMAKAEHIEDKKNEIAREIKRIEKDGITIDEQQELEKLKGDLEVLDLDLDGIKADNSQIDVKTFL